MFCKTCGKQIDEDSRFCRYCGQQMSSTVTTINIKPEVIVPQTFKVEPENKKYDNTFRKDNSLTGTGILIFFFSLIGIIAINNYQFESTDSLQKAYIMCAITTFIIRCFVAANASEYARKLNRSSGGWGTFGFFSPAICLIILGQLKKLKTNGQI